MIKIDYKVQLDAFSGPLDLLCELVSKNKIDIQSIYINEIIKQYLDYIKDMKKFESEQDSEFLIMATKLLNIKSRTILKLHIESEENDDEEDLVTALAAQLEEYIKYKRAALYFREKNNLLNSSFTRIKEEFIDLEEEVIIEGFDKSYIKEGILMILNAKPMIEEEKEEIKDARLEKIYKEPFISVETKMEEICNIVNKVESTNFEEISKGHKKGGKIASFLALLELTKIKYIVTEQEDIFENIFIKKNNI